MDTKKERNTLYVYGICENGNVLPVDVSEIDAQNRCYISCGSDSYELIYHREQSGYLPKEKVGVLSSKLLPFRAIKNGKPTEIYLLDVSSNYWGILKHSA